MSSTDHHHPLMAEKTQKEHLEELHELIRNLIASSQEMSGLLQSTI
jgi:hypothetical protein